MSMPWQIRRAIAADLPELSALCLRSKSMWGYDDAFMRAVVPELTFEPNELDRTSIGVAMQDQHIVGTVQVEVTDGVADLLKLFVDPKGVRSGLGRRLFDWATEESRRLGAARMMIESDPFAVPFYERMGAIVIGTAPSGAIPGRALPLLQLSLEGSNPTMRDGQV